MHLVQAFTRFTPPPLLLMQRIFCRFGYHIFALLLLAWLTLWPIIGFFPHTSQILDIPELLSKMVALTKPNL
jgi:hypothetical protein